MARGRLRRVAGWMLVACGMMQAACITTTEVRTKETKRFIPEGRVTSVRPVIRVQDAPSLRSPILRVTVDKETSGPITQVAVQYEVTRVVWSPVGIPWGMMGVGVAPLVCPFLLPSPAFRDCLEYLSFYLPMLIGVIPERATHKDALFSGRTVELKGEPTETGQTGTIKAPWSQGVLSVSLGGQAEQYQADDSGKVQIDLLKFYAELEAEPDSLSISLSASL